MKKKIRPRIGGWNVREPQNSEPMPPNFQQRAIFVYLRSKDDHKSCTPAGAKLTDEYTPRTNKNVLFQERTLFNHIRFFAFWMYKK